MKFPHFQNKETGRFLRFAIVGSVGAIVDFGILNLLANNGILPVVWASVVSFICAVFSNFTLNRYWTYPDSRSKALSKQIIQFFVVSFIGLAIRTPLFAWLEGLFTKLIPGILPKNFFLSPVIVSHNLALAIVIVVVMIWNFFANRYWTYNDIS
jgi:putative flippase GtrA